MKDTRKDALDSAEGPESLLEDWLCRYHSARHHAREAASRPGESLVGALQWVNETLASMAIPEARRERVREASQAPVKDTVADLQSELMSAQKASKINKMKKK